MMPWHCFLCIHSLSACMPLLQIIESPHDYNNNMDVNTRVHLPGVLSMTAVFDPNSKTESGCDWIQFRQGSENITAQLSGASFPGDVRRNASCKMKRPLARRRSGYPPFRQCTCLSLCCVVPSSLCVHAVVRVCVVWVVRHGFRAPCRDQGRQLRRVFPHGRVHGAFAVSSAV
jgi:hypothetical protein